MFLVPLSSSGSGSVLQTLPPPSRGFLDSLELRHFRNHRHLLLTEIPPQGVLLAGQNGVGKTNVLEALSLLSPGRGLRQASPAQQLQLSEARPDDSVSDPGASPGSNPGSSLASAGWVVRARFADRGTMLAIGWQARQRSRQFLLDETVLRKQQDLTRLVSLNWLTPDMDGLVAGSVQERRRFLDRIIFSLDPSHSRRIRELGLVIRQRHSLLREGRTDETQLSIYEHQISAYGLETLLVRAWAVSALNELCSAEHAGFFPPLRLRTEGQGEALWRSHPGTHPGTYGTCGTCFQAAVREVLPVSSQTLRLFQSGHLRSDSGMAELGSSFVQFRSLLAQKLRDKRRLDRVSDRVHFSPHRTDLQIELEARDHSGDHPRARPAWMGSTGERKIALITLVLAHARLARHLGGLCPILLFDDMDSHLDISNCLRLFYTLSTLGCQYFMTSVEQRLFRLARSLAAPPLCCVLTSRGLEVQEKF